MSIYTLVKEGTFIATHPTGSRHICNPPVSTTDEDYICLVKEIKGIEKDLEGFIIDGSVPTDEQVSSEDSFVSFKQGNLNLIVTEDVKFYDKFVKCTKVAKKLNLLNKEDRIVLFQFGLYGNT